MAAISSESGHLLIDRNCEQAKKTTSVQLNIMAAVHSEPSMKTYTVIEVDPQWMENEYRIHCTNSMAREGLLQFKDGKVTCTGVQNDSATKFKIYNGINLDIMIECTGGNYRNWMLCVDSTGHMLTTRKKTKEYINFVDAEDDVVFHMEKIDHSDSKFLIKWKSKDKNEDKYIGFDTYGQPIPLDKVSRSRHEAIFHFQG